MRVIWKDSGLKNIKPIKYRGHFVTGYKDGWVVDLPGDENIYKNHYCAQNAIDAAFGDAGKRGGQKRISYGIQIVGKRDNVG